MHVRRRMYRKAFEPVSSHSGMHYSCRQKDLDKLQRWPGHNHERFVSPEVGLQDIQMHNEGDREYVNSRMDLRT